MSLKIKLTLFLAAFLVLMMFVLSSAILAEIRNEQRNQYETFLAQQSKLANLQVQETYLSGSYGNADDFLSEEGRDLAYDVNRLTGMPVQIYNLKGERAGASFSLFAATGTADVVRYALQGNVAYKAVNHTLKYVSPLRLSDGKLIGAVQFDYSLTENQQFYEMIRKRFVIIGALICIIGFLIGFVYFHRFASAIFRLRLAAANIQSGRFLKEPPLKRRDELGDLSSGIWFMSQAIQKYITAQKEFLGNVTHEFKTPLTSIRAYADLLNMYADDPELLADAKKNISKETARLQEMVEKVLHLASLDRYEFEIEAAPMEIKKALIDICGRMRGKIDRYGLTLQLDLQEANIFADRESIIHIFSNLLDNAIKYNVTGGEIGIKSEVISGKVNIFVSNTGITIEEEYRDKIFEPFYTINKDRARTFGGIGLGLPLVKQLVEKQNGTIQLLSSDSERTVFVVSFPIYQK